MFKVEASLKWLNFRLTLLKLILPTRKAWSGLKRMSKKDAMIKYIKGVEKIKSGWLSWKGLEGEKAVNFALRAIHFKFSPEIETSFGSQACQQAVAKSGIMVDLEDSVSCKHAANAVEKTTMYYHGRPCAN